MRKGFFITFEGGEGCGKSTHIKALAQYFADNSIPCICTREPGGTPLGEKVRELLLTAKEGNSMDSRTEILLFEAARAEHVESLIKPALAEGKIVLCDRFADSSSAYQGVARKLSQSDVSFLNTFAVGGLTPDLTLLFDIPPQIGLERANKRDAGDSDRMGSQNFSFYEDVRRAFLNLAEKDAQRWRIIDASGTKEETFEKVLNAIKEKFNV